MAHFLRDEVLTNLTIDERALAQLSETFASRAGTMPEQLEAPDAQDPNFFLTYIIRFDNKGYRVFSLDALLHYFRQAHYVERIVVTLESTKSLRSSRNIGSLMELRLDHRDPSTCILTVTSDVDDWVNSSFSAVKEVLTRQRNWSGLARTAWTTLLIQILGVFIGFIISLWAASKIAPNLSIENSFLISFLLALLLFSNLWGYINQRLYALVNTAFPNLKFYRSQRDQLHWLLQAIVGGIFTALTLYLINFLFTYAGQILGAFVGNGA